MADVADIQRPRPTHVHSQDITDVAVPKVVINEEAVVHEVEEVHRHESDPLLSVPGDPESQAPVRNSRPSVTSFPSVFSSGSSSSRINSETQQNFFSKPYMSSLLLDNPTSQARDMDAAERNFLSWIRLAMVLAISGTAIMIDLRFQDISKIPDSTKPSAATIVDITSLTSLENVLGLKTDTQYSKPLGIIFYVLSFFSLLTAIVTYISSLNGYVKQHIVVTNSLSALALVVVIALTIIASNILLLEKDSLFL